MSDAPAATATPEVTRQVQNEINCLRDAFSENDKIVIELEKRLSDVLMGEPPKDKGVVPETKEPTICALANRIRNVRHVIYIQNSRLNHILQRLEL